MIRNWKVVVLLSAPLPLVLSGCETVTSRHIGLKQVTTYEAAPVVAAPIAEPAGKARAGAEDATAQDPPVDAQAGAGGPPVFDNGDGDDGQAVVLTPVAVAPAVVVAPPAAARAAETRGRPSFKMGEGIAYFLPRQLARVTAKRTDKPLAKAIEALAKAEAAAQKGEVTVDEAAAAVDRAESALIAAPDNDTARRLLLRRFSDAQAELKHARGKLLGLNGDVKTASGKLQTIAGTTRDPNDKAFDVTVEISLLPPTADPRFAFRLDPKHSAFRDDEHKFTITPAGLLASSTIVATDLTADILVEIAAFAGAITAGGVRGGDEYSCPADRMTFTGVVDFAAPDDIDTMNRELECLGARIVPDDVNAPLGTPLDDGIRGSELLGIVVRQAVDVRLRIERCGNSGGDCSAASGGWYPTQIISLNLPQAGPTSVLRQKSGFMTKVKYTNIFQDGMLISYDGSRPSELLEVARTPMRLVHSFFDGASKILSLRTGQATSRTGLSQAELGLYNAQIAQQAAVISGGRTLTEAETALLNARVAQQAAAITGQRTLSEAELALIQAQFAQQAGVIQGQRTLSAAELSVLQARLQLQSAGITGQTGLTNDQLALLQAQSTLTNANVNLPVTLSNSELNAMLALMRNQARRDQLNRCVTAIPPGQPIDACLAP